MFGFTCMPCKLLYKQAHKSDLSFFVLFTNQWVLTVFTNSAATVESHDHDDINKTALSYGSWQWAACCVCVVVVVCVLLKMDVVGPSSLPLLSHHAFFFFFFALHLPSWSWANLDSSSDLTWASSADMSCSTTRPRKGCRSHGQITWRKGPLSLSLSLFTNPTHSLCRVYACRFFFFFFTPQLPQTRHRSASFRELSRHDDRDKWLQIAVKCSLQRKERHEKKKRPSSCAITPNLVSCKAADSHACSRSANLLEHRNEPSGGLIITEL